MTNGGIIEGHTENSGCSDLSPVTSCAGQQYYTDDRDWWSKRFGLMLGNQRGPSIWGGHRMVDRKIGHPIAEKEARLRPQLNLSFGSGAGLNNQSSLWRN